MRILIVFTENYVNISLLRPMNFYLDKFVLCDFAWINARTKFK